MEAYYFCWKFDCLKLQLITKDIWGISLVTTLYHSNPTVKIIGHLFCSSSFTLNHLKCLTRYLSPWQSWIPNSYEKNNLCIVKAKKNGALNVKSARDLSTFWYLMTNPKFVLISLECITLRLISLAPFFLSILASFLFILFIWFSCSIAIELLTKCLYMKRSMHL